MSTQATTLIASEFCFQPCDRGYSWHSARLLRPIREARSRLLARPRPGLVKAMTVPLGEIRIQVDHRHATRLTYYKPANSTQLLARRIPIADDPQASMTLSEFLGRAWWAANDKARDLGWIV